MHYIPWIIPTVFCYSHLANLKHSDFWLQKLSLRYKCLSNQFYQIFTHYKVVLEGFEMTVFFSYWAVVHTNRHTQYLRTKKCFNNDVLCLTFFVCLKLNLSGKIWMNYKIVFIKKCFRFLIYFWNKKRKYNECN